MRNMSFCILLAGFGLCASTLTAGTVQVDATASFTGGLLGSWSFQYVSGASDLSLESIEIDLAPTDLAFDAGPGGFGSLSYEDFSPAAGTTLPTSESATGSALDGGQGATFYFDSFGQGGSFQFGLDVDHPNPTLTALKICSGTKVQIALCNLTNAAITAANDAALLGAQTVTSNQMAGATVTFTFGGPAYDTTSFTETFGHVTVQDIINGQTDSTANIDDGDVLTPEPGTIAMFGAGLAGLGVLRRRRR